MQQNITDQELLNLLRTDGDRAMEVLFKNYYSYICSVVYKILPDANLVEDLTQEVFYELWRKREVIHISTSLGAYLRRSAVNRTLNYIRDQKIKFDEEEKIDLGHSTPAKGQTNVEAEELQALINEAVDSLPERCRIVFALSRYEEMTYKEIAAELDISVKTVENQISKALRILRQKLDPYID